MPYEINPLPGEQVLADIDWKPSPKSPQFRFAVSDQAVFLPAQKFVVSGDPRYFNRVTLDRVQEFHIQAIKPYGFYVLAFFMVLIGGVALYSLTLPGARVSPRGLGWGAAFVVGGLLIPFAARKRYRLVVRMVNGGKNTKYVWEPPFVVDGPSKKQVKEVMDSILHAASHLHLPINDERGIQAAQTTTFAA